MGQNHPENEDVSWEGFMHKFLCILSDAQGHAALSACAWFSPQRREEENTNRTNTANNTNVISYSCNSFHSCDSCLVFIYGLKGVFDPEFNSPAGHREEFVIPIVLVKDVVDAEKD